MAKRKFDAAFRQEAAVTFCSDPEYLQKLANHYRDRLIPSKIEKLMESLSALRFFKSLTEDVGEVETVGQEAQGMPNAYSKDTRAREEHEAQLDTILEAIKRESNGLLLICTILRLWGDARAYAKIYNGTAIENQVLANLEGIPPRSLISVSVSGDYKTLLTGQPAHDLAAAREKFDDGKETALELRHRVVKHYMKRSALMRNWESCGAAYAWKALVEYDESCKDAALSQTIELIRIYMEILHILGGLEELKSEDKCGLAVEKGGIFARAIRFIRKLI